MDARRHGYEGEFPGATRPRLEWRLTRLDEPREQQEDVGDPAGDPAREQI